MSEVIHLGNAASAFLVDTPDKPTNTAVVFLPGISGGAFSDRFQPLVDACVQAGLAIARVSAWENVADVERKNLSDIYRDIGNVTTYLQQQGYTQLFGIGKSFGGAIMLTFPSMYIHKKVLWAPTVGVTESGANIEAYMSATFSTLSSLLDLRVDRAFLQQRDTPTLIVHGTADGTIPFSNSEKIVSMLPRAKLLPIEGADHSYSDKDHEKAVIEASVDFLTAGSGVPPDPWEPR